MKSKSKNSNIRTLLLSALSVLLFLGIGLGILFTASGCKKRDEEPDPAPAQSDFLPYVEISPDEPFSSLLGAAAADPAWGNAVSFSPTYSYAGYYGEYLGTVARRKPKVSNEGAFYGNSEYPVYGANLSSVLGSEPEKQEARRNLINESNYLTAKGTVNAGGGNYTFLNAEGKLLSGSVSSPEPVLGNDGNPRALYKHTAAENLYFGNVSDEEEGIIKRVSYLPRGYDGYGVTGVYAPAGEVVEIRISDEDMNATGGIVVHIGQALYNGKANNIWVEKNQMPRMAHLLNTLTLNKDTCVYNESQKVWTGYVGSFLGGPIYIRNESVPFSATLSGGVRYSHFILGYTTREEFEENARSSAPYFDLEVWETGVLHSGPALYAKDLSYDEVVKAAVLWDKVSSVTTSGSYQGIVFLYDPFVAAGAAVAFPGQRSVNCPLSWMSSALNTDAIETDGSWGNFHEYHHNFQGFGVGDGGEVTNNAMSLVSYAQFTKVSAKRGISAFGAGNLSGWNTYTSATWALEEVLKIRRENESPSNGNKGLALYATLLHNFGSDNFIRAKVAQKGGQSYAAYCKAFGSVTGYDMTYYFRDLLCGLSDEEAATLAGDGLPVFVPVSCVYQTGRSYLTEDGKKYFNTMQPFAVPFGEDVEIDLSRYLVQDGKYAGGSIVLPEEFEYSVKSVTTPAHGSIAKIDNLHYLYIPDENHARSGEIVVTLSIKKTDGAFAVDDVDLVLEFQQSHEINKTVLSRTTYTYSAEDFYPDARTAYENDFAGYSSVVTGNHANPTQNCNTDIWFYPDNEGSRNQHPDAPESFFVHDNTIEVLSGKLFFADAGKYRLYLRGRLNCALYYSTDGANYSLGGFIADERAPQNSHLFRSDDPNTYVDITVKAGAWIYIKEVLVVQSSPAVSYIGVGMKKWDGNTLPEGQPAYANAYRTTYEEGAPFESNYYYRRPHAYALGETQGVLYSPTDENLLYCGDWRSEQALSRFGHVVVGKSGARLTFTFTGTRLAILSSSRFGSDFVVQIDGKKVSSDARQDGMSYLSQTLSSGAHTVVLTCNGETDLESIVVFP